MVQQQEFFFVGANKAPQDSAAGDLLAELAAGASPDRPAVQIDTFGRSGATGPVPTFVDEFWTARQRAASSLHEVSYRACFKPALPRFFIERLTEPGDVVLDPFAGRGTTVVEAAIHARRVGHPDYELHRRVAQRAGATPARLTAARST